MGLTTRNLAVSYAMAENTFAVTQTPAGEAARLEVVDGMELGKNGRAAPSPPSAKHAITHVSCGRAIADTAIVVLDENHRPLPDRNVGEIGISSNCMLAAYHHRPDLQPFVADGISDGFYLTGDRGYMADGELYIVGRAKDLIINAGKNVYPQDIEAIVNEVDGVKNGRAVVFGVPDEREGTELIAVMAEVSTEDVATRKTINKAIRQAVATHSTVTVSYVQLVGEKSILKTSSGKLARAANRDRWLAERTKTGEGR
jgi:acyl-CoA synthetase (AMP-forming)/AMP-acid ligase II